MFSVLWDAVCSNVQVKVAVPVAPRAVLCFQAQSSRVL